MNASARVILPFTAFSVIINVAAIDLLSNPSFLQWFNIEEKLDPIMKAAIGHLWFVTLHPFDDGNGRIARAIMDMLLARADKSKRRFYSMSAQIRNEREGYYGILEETQKGTLDITEWILWHLQCLQRAIVTTHATLADVIRKSKKRSSWWPEYQLYNGGLSNDNYSPL